MWYIVTDTTDKFNADRLGINHSAKLHYANVANSARKAKLINVKDELILEFASGAVDFSPDRAITPGKKPILLPT